MEVHELARRLYDSSLEKFGNDKRKALVYLKNKCLYYANISDSKRLNCLDKEGNWSKVYDGYSKARFQMDYYLGLDEEFEAYYYEMREIVYEDTEQQ